MSTPQGTNPATDNLVPDNWDTASLPPAVTVGEPIPGTEADPTSEPEETSPEKKEDTTPKKKVFTLNDIVKAVPINIVYPDLYPDYEPFGFKFRLKLSDAAEDRRQEYLYLSAVNRTIKRSSQALDEVCDLLTEMPTGFGDLQDTGKGPGPSFRSYVESIIDPSQKEFIAMVVEAADGAYWNSITPREFRPKV